ncbi:MAG TPA: O-antigen ligase family protein [Bryobacteraceae bacterium]|nr:O-antigen ligase family protein [Bryobacteraceae bacterium]
MLSAILVFGILTLWVPGRWALSAFQVAICALAIAHIVQRRGVGGHPVGILLAAIAAWGLVQIAAGWSVEALRTQEATLDWVVNAAAFSLALEDAGDAGRRERFLRTFLWFAAGIAILAILTALTSRSGLVFWRFPVEQDALTLGPFVYRNQYAAFVEAILPLAILRAMLDRARTPMYVIIAAILFASVVAGGSRAGTFLCLAEILLIPVLAYAQRLLSGAALTRAVAGSLAAIALAVTIAGWQTIWTRLQEPHPFAVRANLNRSSAAMFGDRPWAGFGLGTWPVAYPRYALYDDGLFVNQAHNDWAQWAVEGGAWTLALMLVMAAWSLRPALYATWGLGIIAVFAHGLIDYPFQQRPALAAFFFAWLGVAIATANDPRPREHGGPAL